MRPPQPSLIQNLSPLAMTTSQQTAAPAPKHDSRPSASSILPAVFGGAVLLGAFGFIGWGIWQAMHPAPVPLQGLMDATTVSVAAKVPGRLAAVTVKEGDQVAAGDAVARLTLPEIEAKVAQAKALHEAAAAKADMAQEGARTEELDAARADLARARAGEHLARVTNTRVAALFKDGLVSTQKRDEAAAQLKASSELAAAAAAKVTALENGARRQEKTAAEALATQAAGGVAEASSLAGEAEVRTPASGEVTRVVMHAGEVVPAGFPVVLVTDLADSWAVFNIREDELKNIRVGTILKANIPALGADMDFSVYWINPRGTYATWRATRQSSGYDLRTFEVRARPSAPNPDLRPGMTVIIDRSQLDALQ